jgi:glutamate carboxypeptidase
MRASLRRATRFPSLATWDEGEATNTRLHAGELERSLPEMLALLRRIVGIESPSTSPAGLNAVAAELSNVLGEAGFEIVRNRVPGCGDQVSAIRQFGHGPDVLILGHTDTVWPLGTLDGWPYQCSGAELRGPGAGDMKSSLVMAVYALRLLGRQQACARLGQVRLLLVPDEEQGSTSSREWIQQAAQTADVCLGLESGPPGGGVIVARGAVGALVVSARGVSAHVTCPDGGRSALRALAPLVGQLEQLSKHDEGIIVTVGMLHGGTARQVVPAYAEMQVDLRAPTDSAAQALLEQVQEGIEAARRSCPADIAVSGGITRPSFAHQAEARTLYEFVAAQSGTVGLGCYQVHERGGGDTSLAAAFGMPVLDGLGPLVHHPCSHREWVEMPSIISRGAVFVSLLEQIAARGTARKHE